MKLTNKDLTPVRYEVRDEVWGEIRYQMRIHVSNQVSIQVRNHYNETNQ
jgi:hypothetical protein